MKESAPTMSAQPPARMVFVGFTLSPVDVGAEVFETGIGHQCDHRGVRPQPLPDPDRSYDVRTRGGPREEGLFPRQPPGHLLRVRAADRQHLVYQPRLPQWTYGA